MINVNGFIAHQQMILKNKRFPIAFWVMISEIYLIMAKCRIHYSRQGLATGDNDRFCDFGIKLIKIK